MKTLQRGGSYLGDKITNGFSGIFWLVAIIVLFVIAFAIGVIG
jgi:hypothetical protein